MRCKCGYDFNAHALDNTRSYDSYAVIHDKDYAKFLNSEIRAVETKDEMKKLRALARSAQFAGFLVECPVCSRLVLFRRDDEKLPLEFLIRETKPDGAANAEV